MRSKLVHEGRMPSDYFGDEHLRSAEDAVFRTWRAITQQVLPQAEAFLNSDHYFEGLRKLKFGATWPEAFPISRNGGVEA
jgi:hypothetical protein